MKVRRLRTQLHVSLRPSQFYLFNITNPAEYLTGSLPELAQLGPYSFIETNVRVNVSFEDNGAQVKYWLWVCG